MIKTPVQLKDDMLSGLAIVDADGFAFAAAITGYRDEIITAINDHAKLTELVENIYQILTSAISDGGRRTLEVGAGEACDMILALRKALQETPND